MNDGALPRAIMLCGPAGSGKTTFARRLEARGLLRLSYDEEFRIEGYHNEFPPPETMAIIERRIRDRIAEALSHGREIVLDFSFSDRATRDDYRQLIHSHDGRPVLVHFDVPVDELVRRVSDRNHRDDANAFRMTPEQLRDYVRTFEVPHPDEQPVTPESVLP